MSNLPTGPFKAYDLMTNEFLGGYDNSALAEIAHRDKSITVIYRPSKKRVKKVFPYQ